MQDHTMPRAIRILIADDHPVIRDGITAIVAAQEDMLMVGEATDGAQAIEQFAALRPDVTLMDLQMPGTGGIEAISTIRKSYPAARIIVLTTYEGDAQAVRALRAGAVGYLLKSSLRKDLLDAIRIIHSGRRYIPADLAQEIAIHAADEPLSERELDVLRLVSAGQANKMIAWNLKIAEETVKAHLKNIFQKLDVADRTHAVTTAIRRGILQV